MSEKSFKKRIKILVADDEADFREAYKTLLEDRGYSVVVSSSGKDALEKLEETYIPLVLLDLVMPDMDGIEVLKQIKSLYGGRIEAIIVTGYGTIQNAVEAMKLGAFGYYIKSSNPESLLMEIEKAEKLLLLKAENTSLRGKDEEQWFLSSKSPCMIKVLETIEKIAPTNSSVLILGESGVGKEVMARLLHRKSQRHNMPFIPINCKAYPYELLDAELFGFEKGAFTGATRSRTGKFEEASGGTLFLDEIGEIENDIQVKLLRVIETKRIERLGTNKSINVDFRLICATNKYLNGEISEGNFREDLFYRISTFIIQIPPLRERKQDIPDLIDFFINKFCAELKKEVVINEGAINALVGYNYPGNIRELRNIVERLVVLCDGNITEKDVYDNLPRKHKQKDSGYEKIMNYKLAKEEFEKKFFSNLLDEFNGNLKEAANIAGLSKRQLYNKIIKYNINR